MRQKELSHCPIVGAWDSGTIKLEAPDSRNNSWDNPGTTSLKALANRHLSRDRRQDISGTITPNHPKELSQSSVATIGPVGQIVAPEPGNRPFVDDPEERAAIQTEAMPVRRIRKRMTSWVQASDEPQPGDHCGCCSGSLWWTQSEAPRGWCCCRCRPPVHLPPGAFRVVAT